MSFGSGMAEGSSVGRGGATEAGGAEGNCVGRGDGMKAGGADGWTAEVDGIKGSKLSIFLR